ncbi:MAG TPA: glycoside hydrolase domain-containing protein [Terriglobales bacterium]|nr:glycoside hydrolase domain-containing protein [Terriglobales bacterium]
MKRIVLLLMIIAAIGTASAQTARSGSQSQAATSAPAYLGFDRNNYPGDQNLKALRQKFSYTGFWLNHPPSAKTNTWSGKRRTLQSAGFGFLVLFNGRLFNELKSVSYASKLGKSDAQTAVTAARREGFPAETVIFLDQEQGGRMLPEQKAHIYAWVDGVTAGGFRAGIYCSGIAAQEDGGATIVTADDIRQNAGARKIVYWVTNDACPPSPGCGFPKKAPSPADSGIRFADIWQFAQSPKRSEVAASCPANYNSDGNCYPPGIDVAKRLHIDVNTATTADPSHGRNR